MKKIVNNGIKERIGKRIKDIRQEKGMSLNQVCLDGESLNRRQLIRIEKGESLPSLETLDYLSEMLNCTVTDLIGEDSVDLPEDYLQGKFKLIRFPVYGDKERIQKKKELINNLYEKYYDILPEEELSFLDIMDRSLDEMNGVHDYMASEIFEDRFNQVLNKTAYSLDDLFLINYYLVQIHESPDYNNKSFKKLKNNLLKQKIKSDGDYNIQLLAAIETIAVAYMVHGEYRELPSLLDYLYDMMNRTQQQAYRPVTMVIEAKYYLNEKKDIDKVEKIYNEAITLATNYNDTILVERLKDEKRKDLSRSGDKDDTSPKE